MFLTNSHFILDLGDDKAARHQRQNSCPTHPLFLSSSPSASTNTPPPPLCFLLIQSHQSCLFSLSSQNGRYVPQCAHISFLEPLLVPVPRWDGFCVRIQPTPTVYCAMQYQIMTGSIQAYLNLFNIWYNANCFLCFRLLQHRSYVPPYTRPPMRRTQEQPRAGSNS